VDITGNSHAMMQYTNYKEGIVHCYGIELKGWTFNKFVNLSKLSTSIKPLRELRNAIDAGDCKFVKLMREEVQVCMATYKAKIEAGEMKARQQKTQSDAGLKQGKSNNMVDHSSDEDSNDEVGHGGLTKHQRRDSARTTDSELSDSN
jgi:hypothetical protein